MSPEERAAIKEKLRSEIARTRQDIAQLEELTRPVAPDNAIGRLSRMEALNSKSVNEAALNAALAKLPKLENALARIDQPEFGYCVRCKSPIPVARLMFMPESGLCVNCARR